MLASVPFGETLAWVILAIGAIFGFAEFLIGRLESLLLESEMKRLKAVFENWWLQTADLPRRSLALLVARSFLRLLQKLLGPSKRGLSRCLLFSTALLTPAYFLVLAASPDSVSLPWKSFASSMETLRMIQDQQSASGRVDPYIQEFFSRALQYDTRGWRMAFSCLYIAAFWYVTGRCFLWSSRMARRFLHEIIKSGRPLSVVALGVSQGAAAIAAGTFWIFTFGIAGNPALLGIPLAGIVISSLSPWAFVGITLGFGFFAWWMTGAGVKLVFFVGLFPLWFTFLITMLTAYMLRFKRAYAWLCTRLLLTCAERGPITVVATILTCAASVIALAAKALSH